MRIISPFKDYYDGITQLGFDDSLVYVRKPPAEETRFEGVESPGLRAMPHVHLPPALNLGIEFFQIRVGSKRVGFVQATNALDDLTSQAKTLTVKRWWVGEGQFTQAGCHQALICYSAQAFVDSFEPKAFSKYFSVKRYGFYNQERVQADIQRAIDFATQFEAPIEQRHPVELLHLKNYRCVKLFENPCLGSMNFQKIMPPSVAHQEISMWLANRANPEKPMVEIDDIIRVEQHGFDKKQSFRTRK